MPPKSRNPKKKQPPVPGRTDAQYEGWPVQVVLCDEHKRAHPDIQGQVIFTEDRAECWLCQREAAGN